MSKRVQKEIQVRTRDGMPAALHVDPHQVWRVRVVDVWMESGLWWHGEGEKVFYRVERVETHGGGALVLYRDVGTGKWFLYRIFD